MEYLGGLGLGCWPEQVRNYLICTGWKSGSFGFAPEVGDFPAAESTLDRLQLRRDAEDSQRCEGFLYCFQRPLQRGRRKSC